MKRTDAWASTPADLRNRRPVNLTLAPETVAILDALALRWGVARSRVVDRLAEGYTSTDSQPSGT